MRRKVVSLRFTILIMIGLFLLQALRNSLAHAHQAKVANSFETATARENGVYAREVKFGQGFIRANNQVAKATKVSSIGGRKMFIPNEVQEDDHKVMKNLRSTLSGAAKVSIGLKVKGDLLMHSKVNDHSSIKLKEAISTTDYRGPRSHPSKHH